MFHVKLIKTKIQKEILWKIRQIQRLLLLLTKKVE